MSRYLALAVFAGVPAPAACNSGTNPAPGPTLGPTCELPAGTQAAPVYPAPGAVGVVDSDGQTIVGSSPALPVGQSGQNWVADGNNRSLFARPDAV